jgi:folate-binding protein YgfZ
MSELQQDYLCLTEQAGAVPLPGRTLLEITGVDAAKFLQNFCTNDVLRLTTGQSCEAFVCNVKGHVVGHVQIHRRESALWIDTVPGQAETLLAHWDRYLIREQVVMHDRTSDYEAFALVGPAAHERSAPLSTNSMVMLCESNYPTSSAQILFSLRSDSSSLREQLDTARLPLCSNEALEVIRVEQGYPLFGVDITTDNLPQEVDRNEIAISFRKGCYLGQETVARIDALGHVNQQLRRVLLESPALPGTTLSANGKGVGKVTSCVASLHWKQSLALAYMRRGWESPGTNLEGGKIIAT